MLTDRPQLKDRERIRRTGSKGWYGDQQKIEAVQMYLMIGSMPPVAAALKIDLNTLNKWRYTEWWRELTSQIKAEGRVQLNGRLQKIVSRSLDLIEDRLENGDFQYDPKTGEMVRKPINARDALRISSDFIDKSVKLDNQTREEQNDQAIEDRLKTLADAFASFASKTKRVEVEDIDAEDRRALNPPITWEGGEEPEGDGLCLVEQDGPPEGGQADPEGSSEELHDSGGEGERPSGEV